MNAPKASRQISADSPGLTRAEVAKIMERNISWVRRREGKDLHPRMEAGVNRFDRGEVESLRRRVTAEQVEAEATDEAATFIHKAFEQHVLFPDRFSVEGIADRAAVAPAVVRGAHTQWVAKRRTAGLSHPPLLSRVQLDERERREIEAIDREYDARMAEYDREEADYRRERAAARLLDEKRETARDAALQKQAPRRLAERDTRRTVVTEPTSPQSALLSADSAAMAVLLALALAVGTGNGGGGS